MADERESPESGVLRDSGRNVDRFVKRERVALEEAAIVAEHAASQSDEQKREQERDPEKEYLKDAARRAHDDELSALANIAIIRSTLDRLGGNGFGVQSREDRDLRLQRILDEPE